MKLESKLKDFFNGQLSDEAEQKMMDQVYNYEFKQLLKQELALHQARAVTDSDDAAEQADPVFIQQVALVRHTLPPSKPRVWYQSWTSWSLAAGVLLLVVMARLWIPNSKMQPTATALIQGSLQNLPPRNLTASPTQSEIEMRSKANTYYDDGNYQEAALAFQQLIDDTDSDAKEDFFYGGLSLLSIKNPTPNYGKAVSYLIKAQSLSQGWKSDDIHYYLAIAYFQNKQLKAAKDLFEQIANHSSTHQEAAKHILSIFPNQ
jgi:tetratricopeptide (TPR) repeat protein